jgi:deoxyribodipyrimidine photo-lyase
MTAPGILWLTRNFRFADNPALLAAITDGPLLVVFVVDALTRAQGAASRWRLERALRAFDAELRRRSGAGVLVLQGEAEVVLPDLLRRTGARVVHQADWPSPQMQAVQGRVQAALAAQGRLVLHPGHLLTHPRDIRTGQGGVYRVYTPFARALRSFGPDRPAPTAPERIIAAPMPHGGAQDLAHLNLAPDMYRGRAVLDRFALPAGETAAQDRLDAFLDRAAAYPAGRDHPDLDATSGLSEHLALGEISPRSLWAIAQMREEAEPAAAAGIGKFLSEVIWREFAWHLLLDFPQMPQRAWRPEWADFPWRGASPALTAWQRGTTGVALVDAGLREMRVTGRMHNRVRMVVASWLTKHLLTDWRLGLQHFEDSLTDWDPAANAMNWQWVAGCGPDASPFFRIFNPEKQAAQYDPQGLLICTQK